MNQSISLGISKCLTGARTRYKGGHKYHTYLMDVLGKFIDYVPVCPEVECGLPTPRTPMLLFTPIENPKLITIDTEINYSSQMNDWISCYLDTMPGRHLCGFILKSKSPSCGVSNIEIHNAQGKSLGHIGTGLFAKALIKANPFMPITDELGFEDTKSRINFIERVFVYKRWLDFKDNNCNMQGLIRFNMQHRLLIMSHDLEKTDELDSLLVNSHSTNFNYTTLKYINIMMKTLQLPSTVKKNVYVLNHIQQSYRSKLQHAEKQELTDIINSYTQYEIPLIIPIKHLNKYAQRYNDVFLLDQHYLYPDPLELLIKMHA